MSPNPLVVRRLTRTIGAVAGGVDLSAGVDDATVERLRSLVDEHQVLVLRGQHLDAAALGRLAARFGPLGLHPVSRLTGSGRPVSTIVDSADAPPAGFTWHTDLSWTEAPPELGFLSAQEIPEFGGDTLWVSGFALHDRLDPQLAARCARLGVRHAPEQHLLEAIERHHGAAMREAVVAANPPVVHPLVRAHPRTGRPALWISPLYAQELVGIGEEEGRELLAQLHRLADDPEVQLRWRWASGDLVIWDEASTCHRALTDHHPQYRRMVRCTTAGTRPRPVAPTALAAAV